MKKTIITSLLVICLLVLSNCGFKVVDKSSENDFFIKQVNIVGDKKIGFILKNNLLLNSQKNNQRKLLINLESEKNRLIKEKNIKNEITKYQITIDVNVNIIQLSNNEEIKFTVSASGDYSVPGSYSLTLSNEKKLIENLTVKLSEEILEEINIKIK